MTETIADKLKRLYDNLVITINTTKEFVEKLADCYTAVANKGGTVPQEQTAANLPDAIESIPSGGGETEVFTVLIPVLEDDAICDLSHIMMQRFPAGGVATFNGYSTYPNRINVIGIRSKAGSLQNMINNSKVKKWWFLDYTLTASTDYLRGTGVESFDFTGLKVANTATGEWREFLNNVGYRYTTLIGDHTLQDVLDGTVVALQGNFIGLTVSKPVGRASILALIKGFADLTGQTTQTLKIHANDLAALTADDLAIAYAKNWNIA